MVEKQIENQSTLLVVGSYNLDLISVTEHLPLPGETVLGREFFTNHGGKGSNQAVAASRLGQHTTFLAKVGEDNFGDEALKFLDQEGIQSNFLQKSKRPTGTAQIVVDDKGENSIVVSPGANDDITKDDIYKNEQLFKETDMVLVQFEIPYDTARAVMELTHKYNKTLIVNPAPAYGLDENILAKIDYLIPNENELKVLVGSKNLNTIEEIKNAGKVLINKGVKNLVITLGENGTYLISEDQELFIPPYKVKMADSTGAGDCFCGAFAYYLVNQFSKEDAIKLASASAALSVTKKGTTTSYPNYEELQSFLEEHTKKLEPNKK